MRATSLRLGIASIVLLGTILIGGPVAFAGIWLSAVLRALAASRGSKWWLVVPGFIVVSVLCMFVLAVYSY